MTSPSRSSATRRTCRVPGADRPPRDRRCSAVAALSLAVSLLTAAAVTASRLVLRHRQHSPARRTRRRRRPGALDTGTRRPERRLRHPRSRNCSASTRYGRDRWTLTAPANFSLREALMIEGTPSYPATFTFDPPEKIANWRPLVQWLLAIPHFVILYVLQIGDPRWSASSPGSPSCSRASCRTVWPTCR